MAITSIRKHSQLAPVLVLAPERYDPRRMVSADGVLIGDIATIARNTVHPGHDLGPCIVLDTSDAREGIIVSRHLPAKGIGSAKKLIQPGDVIISRLRPYLRQVAYVDADIQHAKGLKLLCSTEFFVLRSVDNRSIAFLVPFLLSQRVQEVLSASQEGGHHPRFDDSTLTALSVSHAVLDRRDCASRAIERSVQLYRESEEIIVEGVRDADVAAT